MISVARQVSHLSPGPDLPGRTLLLLTRLHRLGLGGAAETVVKVILAKLTPGLTVLVAFSTGHQALKGYKWRELQPFRFTGVLSVHFLVFSHYSLVYFLQLIYSCLYILIHLHI